MKDLRQGFTLVELMIFFIFISILLAASTPIITKQAKNIPLKMHHGKYICYGDRHEYYNATRLVSSGAGCKFTPPKRASLFKLELVGAGAGGYSYLEPPYETMDQEVYNFSLANAQNACSVEGKGVTCPPDALLRELLKYAPFTLSVTSTSADAGANVYENYVGVSYPTISKGVDCWSPRTISYACKKKVEDGKDEEGNVKYKEVDSTCYRQSTQAEDGAMDLYTCKEINSAINKVASSIVSQTSCGANDWCRTLANEPFISPYKSQVEWFKGMISGFGNPGLQATGAGARGGAGIKFYLDGYIDFCNHSNYQGNACPHGNTKDSRYIKDNEIKSYLSKLFTNYYVTGTSLLKGGCSDWGSTNYKEYPETEIKTKGYKHGKDGRDVLHYDAIRAWGACTTNSDRPKGGEGGWLRVDEESSMIYGSKSTGSVRQGVDAVPGLSTLVQYGPYRAQLGDKATSIPAVSVRTELNTRHHTVGNGGGAAKPTLIKYVSNLGNDCYFSVGKGGPPIEPNTPAEEIKSLEKSLDTYLSCNNGTLFELAEGGRYNTGVFHKSYPGFLNLSSSGYFAGISIYDTYVPGGLSPYVSNNVFTKYNIENPDWGAGGRGSEIYDFCTKPYGEYELKRMYGSTADKTIRKPIDRVECDESKNVNLKNAVAGSDGVIIISW